MSRVVRPRRRPLQDAAGFTLVEVMMVATVTTILLAMTTVSIGHVLESMRGDSALASVTSELRRARDQAINRRGTVWVLFYTPNQVRTMRYDAVNGWEQLNQMYLEGNVRFLNFGSVPDTPDGFGDWGAIAFPTNALRFTVEGTLVDLKGAPVSGTIFLGLANEPGSARAVTVFGGTGQVRGYRWTGTEWLEQ